jgi:hypothetical protein
MLQLLVSWNSGTARFGTFGVERQLPAASAPSHQAAAGETCRAYRFDDEVRDADQGRSGTLLRAQVLIVKISASGRAGSCSSRCVAAWA